jgi:hypothetical protein
MSYINYVVASKEENEHGKRILMSFAQTPIFKTFNEINRQEDCLPNCYDLQTARYALKKYANIGKYEVIDYLTIKTEYSKFLLCQ